jgi:hypothetical protein
MPPNKTATEHVKDYIRAFLQERFKGEFTFEPIEVIPQVDQDGDDYLQIYIVFEGDQQKLNPSWTLELNTALWEATRENGFQGVPAPLFVEKSECVNGGGKLGRWGGVKLYHLA